ncbi:MAG: flagellar biosynthesis protein FlhF [Nitrospinales bacterium]
MRIKKFTADDFTAVMAQVKKELGDEALILNTRSIQPNRHMWPGEKSKVEITAAVDYPDANPETPLSGANGSLDSDEMGAREPIGSLDLESLVYTLLSQTDRARSIGLNNGQLKLFKKLVDNGVHEKLVSRMFRKINSVPRDAANTNPRADKKALTDVMKRALVCKGPARPGQNKPKVVALVGPTGAGKTTTLAKLAAYFSIKEQKKVALISLDDFRVGAVDQLKIYGGIMQLPVETASEPREYRKHLRKHADKDFIFVDTMGKCHKNRSYARRLNDILGCSESVETHLVLSVTLQEKVFLEAFKQFSPLKLDRVLFTKLDEGVSYGSMFNFSLRTKLPFSYFTNGQKVPEDIEVAVVEKVIRLLFN